MGCCGRLYTEIFARGLKKSRGSLNDAISAAYVTQSLKIGWSDMGLKKSRGSLNDAISAAYVTHSLKLGWSDMTSLSRL